jgi:hypothetical protein
MTAAVGFEESPVQIFPFTYKASALLEEVHAWRTIHTKKNRIILFI